MQREKFVRNILSNIIIGLVIVVIGGVSLSVYSLTASKTRKLAIYRGNPKNSNVSLMINVYWGTEYLDSMLSALKDNNVLATFFVGGSWVAENNSMLNRIADEGHEIGNHGYYHKDHDKINRQRNYDEINITHKLVKTVADVDMNLFAPPSGAYNNTTIEVAEELNYKTIMWSKDTIDWRDKDADLIYNRATKNLMNGDLILMHPTEKTAEALDRIIKSIKEKGFNIVPVSINIEGIN